MTKQEFQKFKSGKTSDLLKALEKEGYTSRKTGGGSHAIYTAENKPSLSIPLHKEVSPGTWRNLGKLLGLV